MGPITVCKSKVFFHFFFSTRFITRDRLRIEVTEVIQRVKVNKNAKINFYQRDCSVLHSNYYIFQQLSPPGKGTLYCNHYDIIHTLYFL